MNQLTEIAEDYGLHKLSEDSGISRPHIYRILSGKNSPSLETLESLLSTLGYSIEIKEGHKNELNLNKEDHLSYAMAHYGAPLVITKESKNKYAEFTIPDVNKVIYHGIKKGRYSAKINSVLPFFIHKNFNDSDFEEIIDLIDDRQYLGYVLEILYRITLQSEYIMAISQLNIDPSLLRVKNLIKGTKSNKYKDSLLNSTKNSIAKTWKFRTLDSFESIKNRFNKWCKFDLH